ncbi:MAG: ChaN family lipoprotein [Planctomycetota bacterium]|nr:ChaN family lipoprotein [Planctomycetota bacterium]
MSGSPVPARERLMTLQRNLSDQTRREIDESIIDPSGALSRWRKVYEKATEGQLTPISIDHLAEQIVDFDVVHFGDYHTLRESQKGPLRVIEKWIQQGNKVVLATEAFHIDAQPLLDRWCLREIDDEQLLRESDWENRWGFPWRNYSVQMEFFREAGLPIVALNSEPEVVGNSFAARENIAAMRILEVLREFPDATLAVIFGDLHVAPEHLPRKISELAKRTGFTVPRQTTVFQNLDRIYWQLAKTGLEQTVTAVRIGNDRYCMINTTPLVKHQSYLNWQLNEVELEESSGFRNLPSISSTIMSDQVWMMIETICGYLELSTAGLDGFTVHTGRNLDLLDRLRDAHSLGAEQMELVNTQLSREESCYLPDSQVIVLGNLSSRHAAEEAAHHINSVRCNETGTASDSLQHFYEIAIREAIGYIGTKIIDHKRTCLDVKELESLANELSGHSLDSLLTATLQTVRDSLRHIETEQTWLEGDGGNKTPNELPRRDQDIRIGTAHLIGYRLGEKIYNCLVTGKIKRSKVRELFETPLRHPVDASQSTWLDWARRCYEADSSSSSSNSSRG